MTKKYSVVPDSKAEALAFVITWGLKEGYGNESVVHTQEEATFYVAKFLKKFAAKIVPGSKNFIPSGTLVPGTTVYAWNEGEGRSGGGHEPSVVFMGEVTGPYNTWGLDDHSITEAELVEILNEFASEVGSALGQTRVYVRLGEVSWILQQEKTATPTGD
ncbi:MAG: hypothetical protein R3B60_01675 [Candidatus Paceibacterota bacterium]